AARTAELDARPRAHRIRQHRELRRDELVPDLRREIKPVREQWELAGDRREQLRVAMTERDGARAGQEVDEDVPVEVLDVRSRAPLDRDSQTPRIGADARLVLRLTLEQPRGH